MFQQWRQVFPGALPILSKTRHKLEHQSCRADGDPKTQCEIRKTWFLWEISIYNFKEDQGLSYKGEYACSHTGTARSDKRAIQRYAWWNNIIIRTNKAQSNYCRKMLHCPCSDGGFSPSCSNRLTSSLDDKSICDPSSICRYLNMSFPKQMVQDIYTKREENMAFLF